MEFIRNKTMTLIAMHDALTASPSNLYSAAKVALKYLDDVNIAADYEIETHGLGLKNYDCLTLTTELFTFRLTDSYFKRLKYSNRFQVFIVEIVKSYPTKSPAK